MHTAIFVDFRWTCFWAVRPAIQPGYSPMMAIGGIFLTKLKIHRKKILKRDSELSRWGQRLKVVSNSHHRLSFTWFLPIYCLTGSVIFGQFWHSYFSLLIPFIGISKGSKRKKKCHSLQFCESSQNFVSDNVGPLWNTDKYSQIHQNTVKDCQKWLLFATFHCVWLLLTTFLNKIRVCLAKMERMALFCKHSIFEIQNPGPLKYQIRVQKWPKMTDPTRPNLTKLLIWGEKYPPYFQFV